MTTQWTDDDELRLVIMLGLRKGLAAVQGARRAFTEDEQKRIAGAILDHLRLSNYTITSGRRRGGHSDLMPPRRAAAGPGRPRLRADGRGCLVPGLGRWAKWGWPGALLVRPRAHLKTGVAATVPWSPAQFSGRRVGGLARSEERRVGKECRSRWSPY